MAVVDESADKALTSAFRAEWARRRHVVMGVSATFAVLTILATAQVVRMHAPLFVTLSSGVGTLGFGAAYLWARHRRGRDPSPAAVTLLAVMQLQHLGSAVGSEEAQDVGAVLMFSGLLPLIAASTLHLRGTVITTATALGSVALAFFAASARGLDELSLKRSLVSVVFFIVVSGVVGAMAAYAARRARLESVAADLRSRRAASATQDAEARFRAVANQVSDLVSVVDRKGRHIFASDSFQRILGVSPGALLGDTTDALVHPEDLAEVREAWLAALHKEQTREVVTRLRTVDDSYRTFHVRLVGLQVDAKPHVAAAARDITELQSLTSELESVRRMDALGRLAGGVAHDFNNLLSVLGSCASLVSEGLPKEHASQRELRMIDEAVDRAANLTSQLLAFARRQVLPTSHVKPGKAVTRLEPLLQHAAGQHVTLRVEAHTSDWDAQISESQLEQILMNLVVNARDAMPEGGDIHVRLQDETLDEGPLPQQPAGDYVRLEVQDTGVGMSPEVLARVFEPFYTTKGSHGTGLGLATSFGIARQVGGNLKVESAPGHGSTFCLQIPRSTQTHQPQAVEARAAATRSDAPRLLVVDDEPHICNVVAEMARATGMRVVTAQAMDEALAHAEASDFDTILTDVVLGSDDGLDMLEKLRRRHPAAHVVVMSGYTPAPERLAALRQTGVGFLSKPFTRKALLEALRGQGE